MAVKITLRVDSVEFSAELNESPVAVALAAKLPAETRVSRWGDEYYGPIGLHMPNDSDARDVVEIGALAYWPSGDSLCIFFGPTPASRGNEPRAASDVTVLGRITDGRSEALKTLGASAQVHITRV